MYLWSSFRLVTIRHYLDENVRAQRLRVRVPRAVRRPRSVTIPTPSIVTAYTLVGHDLAQRQKKGRKEGGRERRGRFQGL